MEPDPIEIRIGNYFEYRHTVKEITMADLAQLETLLPELKPIPITSRYLARLNFVTVTDNESVRHFQKYSCGIYFNLYPKKSGIYTLYINSELKLPHIQAIHQLQNVYYELTGDILKRQPPSIRYEAEARGSIPPPLLPGKEGVARGSTAIKEIRHTIHSFLKFYLL